jgi:hypothetical protein
MKLEICEVHDMRKKKGSTCIVLVNNVQQCVEFLSTVGAA